MAEAKKLSPEVAAKYGVIPGIGIGEMNFKGRIIHLDQLTLAEADVLFKDEHFDVLVEKKAEPLKKAV